MRGAALAAVLALTSCGGDNPEIVTVGAAASLRDPLTQCLERLDAVEVRLELAGSDTLAAQIRQGVDIDVYAAADPELARGLARDGLAGPPAVFARNELVLAVPAGSAVRSLEDLEDAPGVRLVLGADGVPVGRYAREALRQLPAAQRAVLEARVHSKEPDVGGIVGKLATGAADAALLYRTDVLAAGEDLRAVVLPAAVAPDIAYSISAVDETAGAKTVVEDVLGGGCAAALRAAGFGAPR